MDMLNKEYYKDAIFELAFSGCGMAIIDDEPVSCSRIDCTECAMYNKSCEEGRRAWANSEFVEKTNWATVKKDTPILVRNNLSDVWVRRYFAKFEDGHVYAYNGGCTSWSGSSTGWWKYAKLSPITTEKGQ